MNSYTAHLKPGHEPILVKEAFAWGAFLFGPLWFAANRAWVPAAFHLLLLALLRLAPGRIAPVLLLALAALAGLLGRDLVRWAVNRRGYTLAHVLAARDEDAALGRLFTYRPEIVRDLTAGLAARVE